MKKNFKTFILFMTLISSLSVLGQKKNNKDGLNTLHSDPRALCTRIVSLENSDDALDAIINDFENNSLDSYSKHVAPLKINTDDSLFSFAKEAYLYLFNKIKTSEFGSKSAEEIEAKCSEISRDAKVSEYQKLAKKELENSEALRLLESDSQLKRFKNFVNNVASNASEINTFDNIELTCKNTQKLADGSYASKCSLLPARTELKQKESNAIVMELMEGFYLLEGENVLNLTGAEKSCEHCLGKLGKTKNSKPLEESKKKVINDIFQSINQKNIGVEVQRLAGSLETLVDFHSVRGEGEVPKSNTCLNNSALKEKILATCKSTGVSEEEANKRLQSGLRGIGVSDKIGKDKVNSNNLLGHLLEKISYSENSNCQSGKNSRRILQSSFANEMYAETKNGVKSFSSDALDVALRSLKSKGIVEIMCDKKNLQTPRETLTQSIKIGGLMASVKGAVLATGISFGNEGIAESLEQAEKNKSIYKKYLKLIGKEDSAGKEEAMDYAEFIVSTVTKADPLLNIMLSDQDQFCNIAKDESFDMEAYLKPDNSESGQENFDKHQQIAKDYSKKCEDTFENLAKVVCENVDEDKKEDYLGHHYSKDQIRSLMKERLSEVGSQEVDSPSSIGEKLALGALSCKYSSDIQGNKELKKLGTVESYRLDVIKKDEVSSLLQVDLFKKEPEAFGGVKPINFQSITDKAFCEGELEKSNAYSSTQSILYKKSVSKEDADNLITEVISKVAESKDGNYAGIGSAGLNEHIYNGGSASGYAKKQKDRYASSHTKRNNNVSGISDFDLPINPSEKVEPTVIGSGPTENSFIDNILNKESSLSNEPMMEGSNFSADYAKNLENAQKVDELMDEDVEKVSSSKLSEEEQKLQDEINRMKSELESMKTKLTDEKDDLASKKDRTLIAEKEQELKELQQKKKELIAGNEQNDSSTTRKPASVKGASASNDLRAEKLEGVGTSLSSSRGASSLNANSSVSNIAAKQTAISSFNNNPEFSFSMQLPPTGLELKSLLLESSEADFNIKYDRNGEPWLVQIAGETEFFDLREMSKEDRDNILKKLHLDLEGEVENAKIAKKKVESIQKSIKLEAKKKVASGSSLSLRDLERKMLSSVMQASVVEGDKQLVSIIQAEIGE